jgi:thymidylate kinase
MLVSFEGQDGAGKTSVLDGVNIELRNRRIDTVTVEEFSASALGDRLLQAVAADKFLRVVPGQDATALTRALDIIADLFYLDAQVIGPHLARGALVLKDRHVDTCVYTLAPSLIAAGAFPDRETVIAWLTNVVSPLRWRPALTVYVDAPLEVRLRRIRARVRALAEDRANDVSEHDIEVFQARDEIARAVAATEPHRFLTVENGDRPLADAVREVVDAIDRRRTGLRA